ncbi:hypothetical protein M2347_004075 [Chryseobacterium sp. H1D6B]|uniref:fibronectin type III domain-containing protein n=1 Tax=Chryseobacterium sp. H1D6B TaxID=2940588 RepID=UPI0015CE27EF|nr:fibronectin type III domain-containing protein [Chryseobacterium sp. H1D6B]MDH6254348.1 hypothetical protein [Chryseobacterium sp. H1D6B]
MRKTFTFFIFLLCLIDVGFITNFYGQAPAVLPYNQDFSTANDLTFVNGTQVNKWVYGSAAGNTGSSIYISNNGTANSYTIGTSSVTQAYRDITIPAGSTIANFSFDWKADGETTYDYLRVWLVPASFTPTAGTQIAAGTGRIQLGANYNQQTTWLNYLNTSLNVSSFAGSTMRLVFEWRNDSSGGTQPPVAIDNISLSIPTCLVPSALSVPTVTANSASISWTPPSPVPANGYQYYINTTNTAPTAATVGTSAAGTSVNLPGLAPNTTYYWWVRSVCSTADSSMWVPGPNFTTTQVPATIPYTQNFSTGNDFGFTNGTQTNKWAYGAAAGNTANSIYISENNGTANTYNVSSASVVQAYRDIAVPAGTTTATLSFDWKADGESTYDYLRVWLVPASYTPVAGTQIAAGTGRIQLGTNYNQQAAWQNYLNTSLNVSSFAGTTMRLVFEWRNDASGGTQPPAAVDNINLLIPTCKVPTALMVGTVNATSGALSWTAPSPVPANGYAYYFNTTNVPPVAGTTPSGTVAGTSITLTPLLPNTTYYWWVRSVCSTTDSSLWIAGPNFTTTQIPATIPYIQDFSTGNDLGFTSGTQVNKWAYGAATGNTANSIYISENNGTANTYNISSTSVVQAYRDIAVPAGTTTASLSFDWKAVGESTYDYLRVWLVPASYMPVAGTQIAAGTGRVQLGANYNQQTAWQTYLNANLNLSSFAGTTMRLVFEWRNDGSGGTQPPAAVDNIKLLICSNAAPVVTVSGVTHNAATLTWPQNSGGASYLIRYRPLGTATWSTASVAAVPYPTPNNTYTLSNLLPVTSYEVEVAAVCNGTAGSYVHKEFTTRCDPTPPNVTISNVTANSALVTWGPLAASSTYTLRYRVVGSAAWIDVNTLPPSPANTYSLTGLSPYTTYEVQVANKCNGETTFNPYSNPKVFTTERTCEMPPPGLTITDLTPTSAVVVWDPFPGSTYILRYRKVGIPSWTNVPVVANTYTITGLTELTKYEMQVVNVCSGTPGNYTLPYYFITPTVTYCRMAAVSSAAEFISKVTVKPNGKPVMENSSTGSVYTDYTGIPAAFIELVQGSTGNEISIEKSWIGNNHSEGIAVWIDFDRNGTFDVNERIFASAPNTTSPVTGTFSVPADAFISMADYKYVVMRVAMQRDGIPINCIGFANGEVEDYTVRISKQAVPNAVNQDDILIYPNPVSSVLYVKNISKKANYKLYNAAGQLISSGILLNNKIDVSRLINGVYVIAIEDGDKSIQKKFIKE